MISGSLPALGCVAAASVLTVFDALGYGGFLLGDDRQVLACNGVAANVLGSRLTLRNGRVATIDAVSDKRLQSTIDAVLTQKGPLGAASVGVHRESGLPLLVLILHLGDGSGAAANPARLLLAACDPERSPMPREHAGRDARPHAGRGQRRGGHRAGRQLAEIAADRGIGVETVRSHSKMVFGKTQTRGQAGLAARLAMLVPVGG